MKTITAKDFQLNQSEVMKDVAAGKTYQVTFHGKPWVELRPSKPAKRPRKGSMEAYRQSLNIRLESKTLPDEPDYKALRRQQLIDRYGR